jgi:hypothetical protein
MTEQQVVELWQSSERRNVLPLSFRPHAQLAF